MMNANQCCFPRIIFLVKYFSSNIIPNAHEQQKARGKGRSRRASPREEGVHNKVISEKVIRISPYGSAKSPFLSS